MSKRAYQAYPSANRFMPAYILFALGIALTVALYYVKMRAQSAKAELDAISESIRVEETAIDVLQAELAFLESPARIAKLARSELGMEPVLSQNVIQLEDIRAMLSNAAGPSGASTVSHVSPEFVSEPEAVFASQTPQSTGP